MGKDRIVDYFFALLRAGLWEKDTCLSQYCEVDLSEIYKIAENQSVLGLITAGLDHVADVKIPQEWSLQFIGATLQLEQSNKDMNLFVAELIDKMRKVGIYTLLVKGQSVAQCYERPLWRANGDVDLFLSDDNYERAKSFLIPLASVQAVEGIREKHLGMNIGGWEVELHGRLYSGLSSKIERELDAVQNDTFFNGAVRSWNNNGVQIFLLKEENDIFYVFTHILQHFYKEGVGVRQICDWCRLLWTYRNSLDLRRLELHIKNARLWSEWRAFGAFSVEYLGMPIEAMPFYSDETRWKRKADHIKKFILEVGNMGHNRNHEYFGKYPYVIRKSISMGRRVGGLCRHARIFPLDSISFSFWIMFNGLRSALRGE